MTFLAWWLGRLRQHRCLVEEGARRGQVLRRSRDGQPRAKQDGKIVRAPSELDRGEGDAKYVHITSNATIAGVQYHDFPDTGDTPLVADMSSDILWRPIDVSKFGLIYAGAQKNLGPAGVTLVIVRKDWMEQGASDIPDILQYRKLAAKDSALNTPPTFAIYTVGKVLAWVKAQGRQPRRWRSATAARPRCSTASSTRTPTSIVARSRRARAP